MVNEFIAYLIAQLGEPYVWGGQHTLLTPENYVRTINRMESGQGSYPDGTTYAQAAIDYCTRKFNQGATELYAYDCSGLGTYWLYNLQHLIPSDLNSDRMMQRTTIKPESPKKGWWVFKVGSDGKAYHIGYMIDNNYLIQAKGRKFGVVKTKFKASEWNKWGIPNVFQNELEPAQQSKYGVTVPETFSQIDWQQLKNDGIDFAMLYIGDLLQNGWYFNSEFLYNVQECLRYDIPFGIYTHGYCLSEYGAITEATNIINVISQYNVSPDLGIWYIWDSDSDSYVSGYGLTMTNDLRELFAKTFCQTIWNNNYSTGVFSNALYLTKGLRNVVNAGFGLWYYEEYTTGYFEPTIDCSIWQYTFFWAAALSYCYIGENYTPIPSPIPIKSKNGIPLWMLLRYLP